MGRQLSEYPYLVFIGNLRKEHLTDYPNLAHMILLTGLPGLPSTSTVGRGPEFYLFGFHLMLIDDWILDMQKIFKKREINKCSYSGKARMYNQAVWLRTNIYKHKTMLLSW